MGAFIAIQLSLLPLLLASWWGIRLERQRIETLYKKSLVRLVNLRR